MFGTPNVAFGVDSAVHRDFREENISALLREVYGQQISSSTLNAVASTIEGEMRRLLAATGHVAEVESSIDSMASTLERSVRLPRAIREAVEKFNAVRTRLVQDAGDVDEDLLRSTISSGLEIVRLLRDVPREHNVVHSIHEVIYHDQNGESPLNDAWGVILRTTTPDGATSFRIFPTTRTDLQPGQEVSWEWNLSKIFGPAWYRDPVSGELMKAWDASAEFIGRDLSTV
jgi:hypothetical protein